MRIDYWTRLFAMVLVTMALVGCTGFQQYAGYVFDITTAQPILDYEMEIETPDGRQTVSPDGKGRYDFKIKTNSDYIVRITKAGYRTFVSTNGRAVDAGLGQTTGNETLYRLIMAAMVPTTVTHAGLTAKVADIASGAAINGGFFRMTPTGMAAGFKNQVHENGLNGNGAVAPIFWMPDGGAVAGAIANGAFTIAGDSMLPGYLYTIATVGVPGYRDQTTTIAAFGTSNYNDIIQLDIRLTKMATPGTTVTLIGQSTMATSAAGASTPVPLASDRKVVFLFDRDITMSKTGLKGMGSNALITVTGTVDNDGDGTTSSTTLAAETPGAANYSSNVDVQASGNMITITLAADSTLVTGTIDTDDNFSYTLNAALTNAIIVRDAASSFSAWQTLTALGSNATVVIRSNFP